MTINELLEELEIPTAPAGHHHQSAHSGFTAIDCPFCSPGSGGFRMGVKAWVATCFTCGSHRLGDTLACAAGVPVKTVLGYLPRLAFDFGVQRKEAGGKLVLPGMRCGLQRRHRSFLRKRGFNWKAVTQLWGLEGFTLHPRFDWSIFIPIHLGGEVVSFTTRSTVLDGRYVSAKPDEEKYRHKSLIYGEDFCTSTMLVVEGPLDVWAGGPGFGCTFGIQYTTEQVIRISKYPRRVVVFDAEPDAQRAARRLCSDLSAFDGETFNVVLETGKDVSRADASEVKGLRKKFLGF